MALATRCPHCETVFRLDPHLLAPHDGRVRCGHCQEVFDAAHHQFEFVEPEAARATPDETAFDETLVSITVRHASTADEPAARHPSVAAAPLKPSAPAAPDYSPAIANEFEEDEPETSGALFEKHHADVRTEPYIGTPPPSSKPAPQPASAAPQETRMRWRPVDAPESAAPPSRPESAYAPAAALPAHAHHHPAGESFPTMREPHPPVRSNAALRIAGTVVAVLLAILLVAQIAWWQREAVMIYLPRSQAVYASVCAKIGCAVAPPRDIDGLQIENSGLRQVDGSHKLELKLSLHNRFDVALAYPALEVTLLDDKNNVAIRRVLWPLDYARPGTAIAAGLPPRGTQNVIVRLDTGDSVAANYRVQIFYP
jgi:predicted Zn finger-like uncharacterized protein